MYNYIFDNAQLLFIIDSIKRESSFYALNSNKLNGGTSNLATAITKLNNYMTKCTANFKTISKYLENYSEDINGFEGYASDKRSSMTSDYILHGKRVYAFAHFQEDDVSPTWKITDKTILQADTLGSSNHDLNLEEGRNLSQKIFGFKKRDMDLGDKIKYGTVVCLASAGEALLDEAEMLIDASLFVKGFIAEKTGNEEDAAWCKEAIALDVSKMFVQEHVYDKHNIDEYIATDSVAATASNIAGSIAVGVAMNSTLTGGVKLLSGVKGVKNVLNTATKVDKTVKAVNAIYDASQALGQGVEIAFQKGASYNEAAIAGGVRAGLGFVKGELESGYSQKVENTLMSKTQKAFDASLRTGFATTTPVYNEIIDTVVYNNDGFNSISNFVTTLGTNIEEDGIATQMLIAGATTGITVAKNAVKNQIYENQFNKTDMLNKNDNYENSKKYGKQLLSKLMQAADGIEDPETKAKKIYNELNKNVSYNLEFIANGGQFESSNIDKYIKKDVTYEKLKNNRVICKGWSELYREALIESGFSEKQVRLNDSKGIKNNHRYVIVDLEDGNHLFCDATQTIDGSTDLLNNKLGRKTKGFLKLTDQQLYNIEEKGLNPLQYQFQNESYITNLDKNIGEDNYATADSYFAADFAAKYPDLDLNSQVLHGIINEPIPNNLDALEAYEYIKNITSEVFGTNNMKELISKGYYSQKLYIDSKGEGICVIKYNDETNSDPVYQVYGKNLGNKVLKEDEYNIFIKKYKSVK